MNRFKLVSAAALALSTACGGGVSSNATVTGTLKGKPLNNPEAISSVANLQTSGGSAGVAAIIISNQPALCADVGANKEPKSSQYLVIALANVDTSTGTFTAATTAGDYTVYGGSGAPAARLAVVVGSQTDDQCKNQANFDEQGLSGVVHLTGVNNGAYKGTFDVTLTSTDGNGHATGTPDHLTGSFDATACAGLGTLLVSNRNATCF